MPVVLLIVGLVVLVAVVYAATGRGGELSAERTDHAPLDLGPVSATDVVLLRPPSAAWGYDMRTTDEALERIAESIRERDVRIVALEQLVTDLSRGSAPAPAPLGRPFPGVRPAPIAEPPTVVDPPARAVAPIAPESLAAAPVPDPVLDAGPDVGPAPVREQARQPEQPKPQPLPQRQPLSQRQQPQPLPQRQPQRQQPPPERSHD